jgi:hypothetical protein
MFQARFLLPLLPPPLAFPIIPFFVGPYIPNHPGYAGDMHEKSNEA